MKTFDEFIKKYEWGTWGYPDQNSYKGECLSLTKHHIKEVYGINPPPSGCGSAKCYWTMFPNPLGSVLKKVPNTPDLIPLKGWIAVFKPTTTNKYGHISSVISANKNMFVSLDANYGGRHAHRVTHNYNNVYGFLAPLQSNPGTMPTTQNEDLQKILTHYKVKSANELISMVDQQLKFLKDARDKIDGLNDDLRNEIEEHKEAVLDYENQIKKLKKNASKELLEQLNTSKADFKELTSKYEQLLSDNQYLATVKYGLIDQVKKLGYIFSSDSNGLLTLVKVKRNIFQKLWDIFINN